MVGDEVREDEVVCGHCGANYDYDETRHCWACDQPSCPHCVEAAPQPLCPECKMGTLPGRIDPMLAKPGPTPPESDDWAFEFKWDGVRAICYWDGEQTRLESRNLLSIRQHYPELADLGATLGARQAILDGEIVAPDAEGRPSFPLLQKRMHAPPRRARQLVARIPIYYYVFDLLHIEDENLISRPYHERREGLEGLALEHKCVRVPPSRVGRGWEMLRMAEEWRLEGLIAKRLESVYQPGTRSSDWRKIKIVRSQEFVVGGWTPREKRSDEVGSLLLGYHDEDMALRYAGRTGTGFSAEDHARLVRKLRRLEREESPFADEVPVKNPRFVSPRLVAEAAYRRWPEDGVLHQASFRGLRPDKLTSEIVDERKGG